LPVVFICVIGGNVTWFFLDENERNEKLSYKF